MSTSLLYHAFGVRDYQYLKSKFVEGRVVFVIEQKPETLRCAAKLKILALHQTKYALVG